MSAAQATGALLTLAIALSPSDVAAAPPERWLSLGGAITETVFALGAGDRLVAVDDTSTYPDAARALPRVGYYRQLATEGILAHAPTDVLADAKAGPGVVLEQLRAAGVRVHVLGTGDHVEGLRARVSALGQLLRREAPAATLIRALDDDLARLRAEVPPTVPRVRVVFVMARGAGALSVAGRETAAHTMLTLAGGESVAGDFTGYRPLSAEALVAAAPDVLVLTTTGLASVGGLDGLLAAPGVALTPAGKARRVVALDDLYLLGFGPRTAKAALELARALRASRR